MARFGGRRDEEAVRGGKEKSPSSSSFSLEEGRKACWRASCTSEEMPSTFVEVNPPIDSTNHPSPHVNPPSLPVSRLSEAPAPRATGRDVDPSSAQAPQPNHSPQENQEEKATPHKRPTYQPAPCAVIPVLSHSLPPTTLPLLSSSSPAASPRGPQPSFIPPANGPPSPPPPDGPCGNSSGDMTMMATTSQTNP